jgi:flavin reductase (DIM6/NTAB) family NADH-FMN oxidoreductase RutF
MCAMATDDPVRVGGVHPFATPPERRDPARRLRGRLVAPVTVWTAGRPPGWAGLTVSSLLVAEGEPARLLGLIDPTSAFWEAIREAGAFVVHLLAVGDRPLASAAAARWPPAAWRGPPRSATPSWSRAWSSSSRWRTCPTRWPGCTAATERWPTWTSLAEPQR